MVSYPLTRSPAEKGSIGSNARKRWRARCRRDLRVPSGVSSTFSSSSRVYPSTSCIATTARCSGLSRSSARRMRSRSPLRSARSSRPEPLYLEQLLGTGKELDQYVLNEVFGVGHAASESPGQAIEVLDLRAQQILEIQRGRPGAAVLGHGGPHAAEWRNRRHNPAYTSARRKRFPPRGACGEFVLIFSTVRLLHKTNYRRQQLAGAQSYAERKYLVPEAGNDRRLPSHELAVRYLGHLRRLHHPATKQLGGIHPRAFLKTRPVRPRTPHAHP